MASRNGNVSVSGRNTSRDQNVIKIKERPPSEEETNYGDVDADTHTFKVQSPARNVRYRRGKSESRPSRMKPMRD